MQFVEFMASGFGRALRAVLGLAISGYGLYMWLAGVNVTWGVVLTIVGLVPLLAGLFDFCLVAPLLGSPFSGAAARQHH